MQSYLILSLLQACVVNALPRPPFLQGPWSPVEHTDLVFYYPVQKASAPAVYPVTSQPVETSTLFSTETLQVTLTSPVSSTEEPGTSAPASSAPVNSFSAPSTPSAIPPVVTVLPDTQSSDSFRVIPETTTTAPPPEGTPTPISETPAIETSDSTIPPTTETPVFHKPKMPVPPVPEISTSQTHARPEHHEHHEPQLPQAPTPPATSDMVPPVPEVESRIIPSIETQSTSMTIVDSTTTYTVLSTTPLSSLVSSPSSSPVGSVSPSSIPVSSSPGSLTPVASAPVSSSPVLSSPVASAPASSSPVSVTPVASAPASSSPVSLTPEVSTLAMPTPVGVPPKNRGHGRKGHQGQGTPNGQRKPNGKPKHHEQQQPHHHQGQQQPHPHQGPQQPHPHQGQQPQGQQHQGPQHQVQGSPQGDEHTVWVTDQVTFTDIVPCSTVTEVITTMDITYTTVYTVPLIQPPHPPVYRTQMPGEYPPSHPGLTIVQTEKTTIETTVSEPHRAKPSPNVIHQHNPSKPTPSSTFDKSVITVAPAATVTLESTLTTSEVQTVTVSVTVTPSVMLPTSLPTKGHSTMMPFNTTVIPTSSQKIRPITKGPNKISSAGRVTPTIPLSNNIFVPVTTGPPPPQITDRGDHPVKPIGIEQGAPIETNKFYANFFLGDLTAPTWTHPYSVAWNKGGGVTGSWGLSVSHVDRSQLVYGPGDPPSYYINPIGLQAFVLSARELGPTTNLSITDVTGFSVNINLAVDQGANPTIVFPLIQGMGFFTGVYNSGTPLLSTSLGFIKMTYAGTVSGGIARYSVNLNDGTNWLIYVTPSQGSTAPTLTLAGPQTIAGSHAFTGTIQVAKVPTGSNSLSLYDASAGVYPVAAHISASVQKQVGEYSLAWVKSGVTSKTLLMFALPHHVETFSSKTASGLQNGLQLMTTTKGIATAVVADSWILVEPDLPIDMGFAPWSPALGSVDELPSSMLPLLRKVAGEELSENFTAQTDLDSMYFSGKALAKFATMVYTTNNLAKDPGLASAGLVKLKNSLARFINNHQIYPLVYDTVWGGAVSSATYLTGNIYADFGNTLYNDHHFHYGYFVYTGAVIGYLDPSWLKEGTNKAWIDMLVRDYANPVQDEYFPFQRMFDWYHGHSWAHGLYETFDGKDQESSSEDAWSSYAIKMWGHVIGDPNMEARGNLQLAIQARSLGDYYLMQNNNTIEPPTYIANKASGILFENKIDHTTYFGTEIAYIEGIHMLPLNPSSTLTRQQPFVSQEWETYFSNGRANVAGGWRGILYANLAIIDAPTAYNFFAAADFNPEYLDGGASRTWYLALCAGLGGVS